MYFERFYNTDLAQASYLIGCQAHGTALVIDPNRAVEQYLAAAENQGLRIVAVAETHIHADYVSGARELADRASATLYLSDEGPAEWKYAFAGQNNVVPVRHGDSLMLGNIRIEVRRTPGHTPEHIAFLVTDTATTDLPIGIATGDFVFVGDVGRPDLLERAAGVAGSMEAGARSLFHSLQQSRELPDFVQIWPGHGSGSACGKALGAVPQSTVGYERRVNWALQIDDEDQFVNEILAGQPEPPPYFAHMKRINRDGPPPRPPVPARLSSADLQRVEGELLVIDTRDADEFAAGHLPGSLNVPFGSSFVSWAGWVVPYNRPLAILVEPGRIAQTHQALLLIGLDNVAGYWEADILAVWQAQGRPLATHTRQPAAALVEQQALPLLIDVRQPTEYADNHIAGSVNMPLQRIATGSAQLPEPQPAVVLCQGGTRSPIAVSLLERQGWTELIDMSDGIDAWQQHQGLLVPGST